MSAPILATKLYLPPPRPRAVARRRLIERLDEGLHRRLTLISAPAGFGKTTLVSEWIAGDPLPAAWLSLDEGDGDRTRFLTYLIAALQTAVPDLGEGAMAALYSRPQPALDELLTALVNEITTLPDTLLLVLDDYHAVESTQVDDALSFLLDHLPPQVHLVIATREDPQLPLARLRARGQLTELRAADLRFTPDEAAEFLSQVMGLELTADEVASLEHRTEGWIAGLQLAALSMQGREDIPGFIQAFDGDNRYIVDYLIEEVLDRQPAQVREFLLRSSILDRLSGALCDALSSDEPSVTGQENGSQAVLDALERDNLFVVPLDDSRGWFRYHHLFADVLQAHLHEEKPKQIPILHRRASDWYEQNGQRTAAIHHALAAEDVERAAHLIEITWRDMDRSFQSATWLAWVKVLPEEVVRARPVLSVGYAWAMLDCGEMDTVEDRLQDAERWLHPQRDDYGHKDIASCEMFVSDEYEFQKLPATIAVARAYYAQAHGDITATAKYARRALDLLPEDDHIGRAAPFALLGLVYWGEGELEAAYRALDRAMTSFRMSGDLVLAISGTFGLADILTTQGRLRDAITLIEQTIQLVMEHDGPELRGVCDLYLGLSELHRERGETIAAEERLLQSEELAEYTGHMYFQYRLWLAKARMAHIAGDMEEALRMLNEADLLSQSIYVPDVRPIHALRCRVWLAQGRLDDAEAWADEHALSTDDEVSFLQEFENITLARILIAQTESGGSEESTSKALAILERLLGAAEAGGRMGSAIEILVLMVLAHRAQGDTSAAVTALGRALGRAEPEGYVRVFVDEGEPMPELLAQWKSEANVMSEDDGQTAYVDRLLAEFEKPHDATGIPSANVDAQPLTLVEPLSEREIEVLELVAEGLSNREIGERLFLALDTVKGHNRRIFGKLQVRRRTEAVARARELGLLR